MTRKVDTKLVNRRLNLDGSGGDSYYRETNSGPRIFSPMFVLALFGVLILGGVGAFFVVGPGGRMSDAYSLGLKTYVSKVEGHCGGGKIPNLNCYLTTDVSRLCDARERDHLRKVTNNFLSARTHLNIGQTYNTIKRSVDVRNSIQSVAGGQMQNIQKMMDGKSLTAHERNSMDSVASKAVQMNTILHRSYGNDARKIKFIESELTMKIRRLARRGLVAQSDFGLFPDALVKKAFEDVGPIRPEC